jgi:urease accessory protein
MTLDHDSHDHSPTHDSHSHDSHDHDSKDTHDHDAHEAHGHSHSHSLDADPGPAREPIGPLRVGIGGPVGSGKTALVIALCKTLGATRSVAVVTNDIYTTEDAEKVRASGALPVERVRAVETGCCPHTAIRDDIAANEEAIEDLIATFPDVEIVLLESGGDNLTATFSPALVDVQLFVIDVAGGDKVPRKGGPGVTRSDLLVINKTDLAPLVGADLAVMASDAEKVRQGRPVLFSSLTVDPTAAGVAAFLEERVCARN